MSEVPNLTLNDGNTIPQFGLGVWQVANDRVAAAIQTAFDAGYRSVDTAALYRNESGVGVAVAATDIPREDLFVTTKLWNSDQGYDGAMRGFDESIRKLKLEYVDLYLIHWPPRSGTRYLDAWKAFEKLRADGRVRSIGVSNFHLSHLRRIFDETETVPAVNQIELHPNLTQTQLREFHAEHGILTEAYSPLAQGKLVRDKAIGVLATRPAAVHMAVPQVSSFVDRRLEITEVRQLLARSRVVTLCGLVRPRWDLQKRLAVAVAEVALSEYPDGIWFVELASHGDAAFVASTIAGC